MVTLTDIAKKAKVSPNTVSRVINGNAEYTRPSFANRAKKIRKIAEQMGYMPNAAAQSMRSGRQNCISLLASNQFWNSAVPNRFMSTLQNEVSKLKYNLVLNSISEGGDEANRNLPRIFKENCVDGIMIDITHVIPEWLEPMLKDIGVPYIWLGSKHPTDCVYHDDTGATKQITEKLLQAGHRNIAYVDSITPRDADPIDWHFSYLERIKGYKQGMAEAGLEPKIICPETWLKPKERVSFILEKLFTDPMPTAAIAYNLESTGTEILFAAARKGLSIPDDMSLATFCSHSNACMNDLIISNYTVSPAYSENAIKMLYEKICNGNKPAEPKILPFKFIEGDTIAHLKRNKPK